MRKKLAYIHGCGVPGKMTPEYFSWRGMLTRCSNPNTPGYERYGGRGIKVHPSWHTFLGFRNDMKARPPGTTLDRINSNGNYEPGNCRWATPKEQAATRRKMRAIQNFTTEELLAELRSRTITVPKIA